LPRSTRASAASASRREVSSSFFSGLKVYAGSTVSKSTSVTGESSLLSINALFIEISDFPEARKPAYKLKIDFGKEIGIKKSSAQLVDNYTKEELKDKLVLGIINLQPRQIGNFISEVLTLGVPDEKNKCLLVQPELNTPLGAKLY